jgi:Protein of unknown function (DUF1441)
VSAQHQIDPSQANISRLALMFQLGRDTVRRKVELGGCIPTATVGQTRYYSISDAARACFGAEPSQESEITDPSLLKPSEQKDYWMAKQKELEYNREIGRFLHQDEVRSTFRELAEALNDKIQSYPDILERDEGLSPKQVDAMVRLCDKLSTAMHEVFSQ